MMSGEQPLWQVVVSHFFVLMMDGKNLITGVQEMNVLFVLQLFPST